MNLSGSDYPLRVLRPPLLAHQTREDCPKTGGGRLHEKDRRPRGESSTRTLAAKPETLHETREAVASRAARSLIGIRYPLGKYWK